MNRQTLLAKIRGADSTGHGDSARRGTRHWWYQRLSAVALIPLSLWFIYDLTTLAALDYAGVHSWIAAPSTSILLVLFILTLFYHALAGMREVIEDYIQPERQKASAILSIKCLAVFCTVASIAAVIKIYLGL